MRIIFKVMKIGLLTLLVFYFGYYAFLFFGSRIYYSKLEIESCINDINNSASMNQTFYFIYDDLYKDREDKITYEYFKLPVKLILNRCDIETNWQVSAAKLINQKFGLATYCLAFAIDRNVKPVKSFDYCMHKQYQNYLTKFQNEAELTSLNDTSKILQFLVARKGITIYSRNNESLQTQVKELKDKLLK